MKFSTLEELKVRQWDVFGRLFESVRRQVGQNWPVQDSRGFIFSVPKTLPDNLIQRGVMALSERTHVLARLSWVSTLGPVARTANCRKMDLHPPVAVRADRMFKRLAFR